MKTLAAALALPAMLALAGCGGAGGGTNYTKLSIASSSACGNAHLSVGDQAEPIISVTNKSGHDWKSTWVWIHGTGHNLKLEPGHGFGDTSVPSIAMDNRPADETYASASLYNMGPLPAGEVGDIHIYLTAETASSPEVAFEVWGNSEANPTPSIPSGTDSKSETCSYAITTKADRPSPQEQKERELSQRLHAVEARQAQEHKEGEREREHEGMERENQEANQKIEQENHENEKSEAEGQHKEDIEGCTREAQEPVGIVSKRCREVLAGQRE